MGRGALLAGVCALAAWGQAAASPPAAVVTNAAVEGERPVTGAKDPDPLVCRSETPIGSKLPVKTCVRKSEHDRQKRESQEALQLIQRRADGPVKTDGPFR